VGFQKEGRAKAQKLKVKSEKTDLKRIISHKRRKYISICRVGEHRESKMASDGACASPLPKGREAKIFRSLGGAKTKS